MNKINWENLPSTATPINADNLNAMQDNIEAAIEEVIEKLKPIELFYDNTASYLSATLNDDITNYDIITVIGQSTDNHQCSTTIYKPSVGSKVSLFAGKIASNTTIYNKQAVYEFNSANTIQSVENHQLQNNTRIESDNFIKLKAVLGYKS